MFFPQNDASTYAKASSFVNTMEDKPVDKEVIESGNPRKTLWLSAPPESVRPDAA